MAFTSWSTTAASNASVTVGGESVAENSTRLKDLNDIIRGLMADLKGAVPMYVANVAALQGASFTADTVPLIVIIAGIGIFEYDSSDATSTDNGTTVIVTTTSQRFKAFDAPAFDVVNIEDYDQGDGWDEAQNRAMTALTANGGILKYNKASYTYDTQPDASPSNVIHDVGNATFVLNGSAPLYVHRFEGTQEATTRTLNANAAVGDKRIELTAGTIGTPTTMAVGDVLEIRKTFSLTTGTAAISWSSLIERIDGNFVYLARRLDFAVATGDTYTIYRSDGFHTGGGIIGSPLYDGSNMPSVAGSFGGVKLSKVRDFVHIGELRGDAIEGDATNPTTTAGLITINTGFNIQLDRLRAEQCGCVSQGDIDIRNASQINISRIISNNAAGFGPFLGNGSNGRVDAVDSGGSLYRGVKVQAACNYRIESIECNNASATGVAFTEGCINCSAGTITVTGSGAPDDLEIASIARASNVVTVTTTLEHGVQTGHSGTIANVTTSSFNGAYSSATRVSATVFTFAQVDIDETGTVGSGVVQPAVSPTIWANDNDNEVYIGSVYFRGVTNAGGDISAGSNDLVYIDSVYSDGFSLTYAGTAVRGTDLNIYRVNGVFEDSFLFKRSSNTYVTAQDQTASTGTTGFSALAADSGGTERAFTFANAAGTGRLLMANGAVTFWPNNGASQILTMATNGDFYPNTTGTSDLGGSSNEWQDLHLNNDAFIGNDLTVSNDAAVTGDLTVTDITMTSTDAGASPGPVLTLTRDSASPAANDFIGRILFFGEDSGSTQTAYGVIDCQILDPTDASEDSQLIFSAYTGGAYSAEVYMGGGLHTVGATGGAQGVGTINATAVYDDSTGPLTDYVFDLAFDGALNSLDYSNDKAKAFDVTTLNINTYTLAIKERRALPNFPNRPDWTPKGLGLGEYVQKLLEAVEVQAVHIIDLHRRIEALERD